MAGTVALLGAAAVTAQDAPDLSGQSLVVSNWEAYMPDDLPAAFTAETGVPVTVANHATNEEVVAKITAGNHGLDVAFVSGQFAQALGELGFLAPLDHAQIPNLASIYPEATQLAFDPGNVYSAPYAWGTTGLCYRTDLLGFEPTSWYDILTPAEDVSGKTTALATERWLMLPAQKALGFSANTTDPAEMEQVKELLLAAKPTLLTYDDLTFYSRLDSGEAVLTVAWDGWCNGENENIEFVVPSEGSDLWTDTMVVLESSANKEAAHAFIDFVMRPENQRWMTETYYYKVPNQAAMDSVDPALIEAHPNLAMTPAELLEGEELVDLGEAAPLYTEIATEVAAQ
jgi:spermidine/putrescine transport system substrate-binding protein